MPGDTERFLKLQKAVGEFLTGYLTNELVPGHLTDYMRTLSEITDALETVYLTTLVDRLST